LTRRDPASILVNTDGLHLDIKERLFASAANPGVTSLCHRTPLDTWGPACILGDIAVSYLDIRPEHSNTLNQLLLATFTIA